MPANATGVLFILIGLALGFGGVWLAALGGSWYYVVAALGFLATGALLVARRAAALWVHALLVAGTLAWAVAEVGLDWWQLAPRGDVVVVLGLWLLTPWITRRLDRPAAHRPPAACRGAGMPLALSVAVSAVVALYAAVTPTRQEAG